MELGTTEWQKAFSRQPLAVSRKPSAGLVDRLRIHKNSGGVPVFTAASNPASGLSLLSYRIRTTLATADGAARTK